MGSEVDDDAVASAKAGGFPHVEASILNANARKKAFIPGMGDSTFRFANMITADYELIG